MTAISNDIGLVQAMQQLNRTLRAAMRQHRASLIAETAETIEQAVEERLRRRDQVRAAHKQNYDQRVKHFIDATKAYAKEVDDAAICEEKFSPEARRFVVERLKDLKAKIKTLEEALP